MSNAYIFTSESVSEGHPDKVCDQISDAILDFYIGLDPHARVAAEVLATTNRVVIAGEIRAQHNLSETEVHQHIDALVRQKIQDIGYDQAGFSWRNVEVTNLLHAQSAHIAQGVDAKSPEGEGAGDQGIMFGYACDETPELMPAPLMYAHRILQSLAKTRHAGETRLLPDAKSQVSLLYRDDQPVGIDTVLVSTQHQEGISQQSLRDLVAEHVQAVFPKDWAFPQKFYVNPTGAFVIGGPDGDAGLTGRKIIVDTYGGAAVHGGGAFSGKDATKVDRSAAYIARYLAKNVVAAKLARKCTIQICYAIGVVQPLAIYLNLHGTGRVDTQILEQWLMQNIDLSPRGIITRLELAQPIYQPTARYGHFGRKAGEQGSFTWEATDLVAELQQEFMQ